MSRISTESLITLRAASKLIPGRRGRGVNLSTIWRWCLYGARGVKLDSITIGGARYTSKEAIARFIEKCSHNEAEPAGRPSRARASSHARAVKELQEAGIA